jgi:hypothetical protein
LTETSIPLTETVVQLGAETIPAVPTGLHEEEIFPGEAGLLGNALLSRFLVTVDAVKGRLILQKNPSF